jgi:hypothetical protein
MRILIAEGTVVTPITVMQTPLAAESSGARTTAKGVGKRGLSAAGCRFDA